MTQDNARVSRSHESTRSPIVRSVTLSQLPPEILHKIFQYSHQSFASTNGRDRSLFAAVDVCKAWQVAVYEVFFDENSDDWTDMEWKAKDGIIRAIREVGDVRKEGLYIESSSRQVEGNHARRDMWRNMFGRN